MPERIVLDVARYPQPDDVSCGPTCLAQIYHYYGHHKPLQEVLDDTARNPDGGTQAVFLGLAALREGFRATIYSYNLRVFDPTWRHLDAIALSAKLAARREAVESPRLRTLVDGYRRFVEEGGDLRFDPLERGLLVRLLTAGKPVLTGLSSTYLYGTAREWGEKQDDVRGEPVGHFVVLTGYDPERDEFLVSDPATHIPFSDTGRYALSSDRLIAAILLGAFTYDAVLVVLEKAD